MNAIEIRNLNKSYEDFILKDINLDIPEGSIVGLIGENGAGKTTLIHSILNLTKTESGEVFILNTNNKSKDYTETKEEIGVVLDKLGIYEGFSINDIDSLMGMIYKNWDSNYFKELLEKFDIYKLKAIKEFSMGMKKKLDISIVMAHHPKLLILDEPMANLDPFARSEILDLIMEFTRKEDKTVLISSHILSDLEKICDYIIFLHKGEVKFFEEKDELLNKYSFIKVNSTDYKKIPKEGIIYEEHNNYGYEVLIYTNFLPENINREYIALDDIIVKIAKGERK